MSDASRGLTSDPSRVRWRWSQSVRLRLTLLYSLVVFALAACLVGALYLQVRAQVTQVPVSRQVAVARVLPDGVGGFRPVGPVILADVQAIEREVNAHTMAALGASGLQALAVLFVTSLAAGWVISGRVLAPVGRITDVAREIQATDLSRRIDLEGPADELKRLADTFDAMLGRLDTAFASQRRFLADASHELRNPLAIVRTNLDVVLADPNASESELREAGTVARRATERAGRLVDDLLTLARLGDLPAVRERVELHDVVCETVEDIAAGAADRGVAVRAQVTRPAVVDGDADALKRAVANLLDNAVRHTPAGGGVITEVGGDEYGTWVRVHDEGPGVPAGDRERIFERFYRGGGRRPRDGGSGLGLTIVRNIVESHGGTVELVPEPGPGATFVLRLPLAADPDD